jgi:carboxyl-terminal processing protease
MTSPAQPSRQQGAPEPRGNGPALGLTAAVLLLISAAVVFWAGMSLGGQTSGRSAEERAAIEVFTETYRMISDDFIGTPAPQTLLEGAIEGMFEVLDDPHSSYMRADEYESALNDARGEFEGIGAVMATEDESGGFCEPIDADCQLQVTEVLEGAPAKGAGLLAGDVVTGVDGTSLEGATIDDSVVLIRGPRGSDVTLTLDRDGEARDLVITRDRVVTQDVGSAVLADGQIGYLSIDGFSSNSADDFEVALRGHLDAGIEKLVVDVRDDPGGFVDATVEISDAFLAGGPVFWEEDARGLQVAVDAAEDGLAVDPALEIVVLVNGGSASASEIFAGALQDAGRAELVGEQTFGKGTVQEWTELPGESGGFRLSVAKWLTRGKTWVDGVGLIPDIPVAGGADRYRPGDTAADPAADDQLQAAMALLLGEPLPVASPEPSPEASPEASPSTRPSPSALTSD